MLNISRNRTQNTEYRVKYAQSHRKHSIKTDTMQDVDPSLGRQDFIVEIEQT